MDDYVQSAQLMKILAHPARLAILDLLRDGEHCVCHLEATLGYRQAYISQQLSVLREAGLVQDRRDGWNIFYRVTQPRVYAVIDAAQRVAGGAWKTNRRNVAAHNCSCPQCSSVETAVT
jgi:ArsR family transcriptional regulator